MAYLSPDHYNEKEQPKSVKDLKFAVPKRRGLGTQAVVHLFLRVQTYRDIITSLLQINLRGVN